MNTQTIHQDQTRALPPGACAVAIPSQDDIARRAMDIHVLRGRPLTQWQKEWQGDWLRAELELNEEVATERRRFGSCVGPAPRQR